MGLFDRFRKNKPDENSENCSITADIFKTICGGDETAAKEINDCTRAPREYAVKNNSQFAERGLSADSTDINTLMWIGCVDVLIKYSYAAELDFNCELEDFIFNLGELSSLASKNITIEEDDFDPEADITEWLAELDEQLNSRGLCVGGVDIDSDSFVVFLTDIQTLEKLSEAAKRIGHKIDYAKNL